MIVSASRRTDIPAFHSKWFTDCIKDGFVDVPNPYTKKPYRVSLKPEDVTAIAFWTKNPQPMIKYLNFLNNRGYKYYFQIAVNGYGKDIERNVPELEQLECSMWEMMTRYHTNMQWRYSPIVMSDKYTIDWHLENFKNIASRLPVKTCIVSVLDEYAKIKPVLSKLGLRRPIDEEIQKLYFEFARIAKQYGIEIQSCTQGIQGDNIVKRGCINAELIQKVTGITLPDKKDKGQNADCRCIKAIDIGQYNTCNNGCVYCYANRAMKI